MTSSLLNNGSYFAHTYFTLPSYNLVVADPSHPQVTNTPGCQSTDLYTMLLDNIDTNSPPPPPSHSHTLTLSLSSYQYDPLAFVYKRIPLVKFQKKRKLKIFKKLLDSKSSPSADSTSSVTSTAEGTKEEGKGKGKGEANHPTSLSLTNNASDSEVIVGYWFPTLALSLVLDMPTFGRNTVPAVMAKTMDFSPEGSYYPIIYRNHFWIQSKEMLEINATHTYLPLKLSYAPIAR